MSQQSIDSLKRQFAREIVPENDRERALVSMLETARNTATDLARTLLEAIKEEDK